MNFWQNLTSPASVTPALSVQEVFDLGKRTAATANLDRPSSVQNTSAGQFAGLWWSWFQHPAWLDWIVAGELLAAWLKLSPVGSEFYSHFQPKLPSHAPDGILPLLIDDACYRFNDKVGRIPPFCSHLSSITSLQLKFWRLPGKVSLRCHSCPQKTKCRRWHTHRW